jgi:uncharacterized protein YukJ
MGHINYQALRGKVRAYAAAAPPTNPHLWVILEAGGKQWFATINVRSDKGLPGEPVGKSYLYYYIDHDFSHPIVPSVLARPQGLSPVERTYAGGAVDFQRGNLFDPAAMRILPPEGAGDSGLAHQLGAMLELAKSQDCDVIFYGNAFAKDNPHQTDAAFGYTPDTPFGLDNIHMAQGDPQAIDMRLHENGIWHDGAAFLWDAQARRMSAIFLAFQSQSWHTNDAGELIYGTTGCEPPPYDFSAGGFAPLPRMKRAAEITSAHRAPDGTASVVIANMTSAPLDLTNWRLLIDAQATHPLPATALAPGAPCSAPLPAGALNDTGGLITLNNPAGLRVDGVAYLGGDATKGWSTAFGEERNAAPEAP